MVGRAEGGSVVLTFLSLVVSRMPLPLDSISASGTGQREDIVRQATWTKFETLTCASSFLACPARCISLCRRVVSGPACLSPRLLVTLSRYTGSHQSMDGESRARGLLF